MNDCCKIPAAKQNPSCCCESIGNRMVLLYSCSGGANVGEIADLAARELAFAGQGAILCLAGLGGDIQGMVQAARNADVNLVLDGCPVECGRKTLERHGIQNYRHLRITDLGIEKIKGVRGTKEQVAKTVAKAIEFLSNENKK